MRVQRRAIMVATVALAASWTVACGGDRDRSADQRLSKGLLSDEEVVKALREPKVVGRIIYDPPPDLSYASARLRRPDLVPPDTLSRRE